MMQNQSSKQPIKNLIIFSLFLIVSIKQSYAQVDTEAFSPFFDDVMNILIKIDRKTTKAITLKLRSNELVHDFTEKPNFKFPVETIRFTFINDSIIRQSFSPFDNHYMFIKNDDIFEYDIKQHKILFHDNYIEKDSAGYRVVSYNYTMNGATIYLYDQQKDSSQGIRIMKTIYKDKPSTINKQQWTRQNDTTFSSELEMQNDTNWFSPKKTVTENRENILHTSIYKSADNGNTWIPVSYQTFNKSDTIISKQYIPDKEGSWRLFYEDFFYKTPGNDWEFIGNYYYEKNANIFIKKHYKYDNNKKLVRINILELNKNNNNIHIVKHLMKIKYK